MKCASLKKSLCLLPLLVLLVLSLSACGGLEGKLRAKAEEYLKTLAAKTGIEDSFTLSKEKADTSDSADPVVFTAKSETYQKNFSVFVSRDGNTVTDSYYTLSLQEIVWQEGMTIMEEALGKDFPAMAVTLVPTPLESLSGRSFASLQEFYEASGGLMLLQIHVTGDSSGKNQLTSDQVDKVLITMQERDFRGYLLPYLSNAIWYDVTPKGIWVTTRTGADNGNMLDRREYTPKADK